MSNLSVAHLKPTVADPSLNSVENDGSLFYVRTNKDAPKYKVVTVDVSKSPSQADWKEFIPESDGFLQDISSVNRGNNFAVSYKRNVSVHLPASGIGLY